VFGDWDIRVEQVCRTDYNRLDALIIGLGR